MLNTKRRWGGADQASEDPVPSPLVPAGDGEASGVRIDLDRVSDAFVAYDREWRFTYLNRRAEEYFGRRRDELIGRCVWTEFPQAVGSTFYREVHRAAAEQVPVEFAVPALLRDAWYGVNVYPSAEGVSIFFRDITRLREAEEVLHESEARYRTLFENCADGVMLTAPDGRILEVNPAGCHMLGYSEEELLRLGRQGIADPTDLAWRTAVAERARAGHARAVLRFRRKDGSFLIADVLSTIFLDERGEARACTILHPRVDQARTSGSGAGAGEGSSITAARGNRA